MAQESPRIDARLIDGKLFVDMDNLISALRSEDGPYHWVRAAANAMNVPEDIALADGMRRIIDYLDISATSLWEELS